MSKIALFQWLFIFTNAITYSGFHSDEVQVNCQNL